MKRHAHAPTMCPCCGYVTDSLSEIAGDGAPSIGDWAVCLRCGTPMVIGLGLVPQLPAPGALDALAATNPKEHAALIRAQAAVRLYNMRYPFPDRAGHA